MSEAFFANEPMLEMYIFETTQLTEQLEEIFLRVESTLDMTEEDINEIFRIMHTIKGSSAMMSFSNISELAHKLEDLFFFIRDNMERKYDFNVICEFSLKTVDFFKKETSKIQSKSMPDGDSTSLQDRITAYLAQIKENKPAEASNRFKAKICFEKDCGMENIRAFTIVRNLTEQCTVLSHFPEDLMNSEESSGEIAKNGFVIEFVSPSDANEIRSMLENSLFVESVTLEIPTKEERAEAQKNEQTQPELESDESSKVKAKKNIISINVDKMDKLMDLVGEITITESMVTNNPDLRGIEQLDNFMKAARQLRKLNEELQDLVMSIRMIPIASTFHSMHRIVRDMNKKLGKQTELVISGEETEVDKNIIDSLGEPLMHIVRNSLDHGIEDNAVRISKGKSEKGKVSLEAFNTGGDIIIRISDDGKGLDKEKILTKAREKGLVKKPDEEITEKEIFGLIFHPGFSTNSNVTEYSGRGVGMDVVRRAIEKIGGNVSVESQKDQGTSISIKIPLTLAIVDSIKVSVGESIFSIPITSMRESLKLNKENVVSDSDNNEIILIRDVCYPIVRLHKEFNIKKAITELRDGIIVMIETEAGSFCVFADNILGEQQVVVKPIPAYLRKMSTENNGIAGCAILGDGTISLILDVDGIYFKKMNVDKKQI